MSEAVGAADAVIEDDLIGDGAIGEDDAGVDVIEVTAGDITIPITYIGETEPEERAFFLGIAKSGSTLLHMIVEDVCRERDARLINISDSCFAAGYPERKIPEQVMPGLIEQETAFYYGFRCIGNLVKSRTFRIGSKVMLIRDPRDALTSLYFSMLKSHSIPQGEGTAKIISEQRSIASASTINEFILSGNGDFILRSFSEVETMSWLPNFHIYRYEDIIFNKIEWLRDVNRLVNFGLSDEEVEAIAGKHDIRPSSEDSAQHIRQVAPGNYKTHLNDEAIAYIDGKCKKALKAFGYV